MVTSGRDHEHTDLTEQSLQSALPQVAHGRIRSTTERARPSLATNSRALGTDLTGGPVPMTDSTCPTPTPARTATPQPCDQGRRGGEPKLIGDILPACLRELADRCQDPDIAQRVRELADDLEQRRSVS